MTPHADNTTSGAPLSPEATPAEGKQVVADAEVSEEVEVALGDDAPGAIGSSSPIESAGVDTGSS